MSKANFNESRKIGVHLVSRDSAGLLQTWRENGYEMAVSRDTAGRVNYVTASGPAGTYKMGISRNSSGDYIGTTGDFLNTALLPEIISSMVGRGLSFTTSSDGGVDIFASKETILTLALRSLWVRVVYFGDSIAEQIASPSPHNIEFIDTGFPASGQINSFGRNLTQSALRHYYPLAEVVGDGGIGGQTTAQMLARDTLPASSTRKSISDMLDLRPDVVILSAGSINNLTGITEANYAATVATTYSEHVRIIERFRTGRATVIDDGFFGYSAATASYPDLVRKALLELNAKYADYAKTVPGVIFIDHATKDATGNFLPAMSNDGIHPGMQGGRVRGKAEARALTLAFGKCAAPRFQGGNLCPNPLFASTGAYGGGTLATGITFGFSNVTLQNSKIESRNGRLFQTVEAIPTATTNLVTMTLALDPTTWNKSAGDVLGYEIDILLESLDGASGPQAPTDFYIRLDLQKTGAGKIYATEFASRYEALSDPVDAHVSYKVKLPEASSVIGVAQIYLKYQTNALAGYRVGIGAPRII